MRKSWDEYFMDVAKQTASRSTCMRRQVGAVAVIDKKIVSTGYNGAPSRIEHCESRGCIRQELNIPSGERHEMCYAVHAEMNCIIQAETLLGATIYCTHFPCSICTKMLINAGVVKIVYNQAYPDELSLSLLNEAHIEMVCLSHSDEQPSISFLHKHNWRIHMHTIEITPRIGFINIINDKDKFIISNLIVDEQHRKQGYGHLLIKEAIRYVETQRKTHQERQFLPLTLSVIPGEIEINEDILISMYEKRGFVSMENDRTVMVHKQERRK